MNNNDYTRNDSRRIAVEDWDVSDVVPNIVLEDISKNEVDKEVNIDIMVAIVSMVVNNFVVATAATAAAVVVVVTENGGEAGTTENDILML